VLYRIGGRAVIDFLDGSQYMKFIPTVLSFIKKHNLRKFILLLILIIELQVFLAGHVEVDMTDVGRDPARFVLSSRYPALMSVNIATVLNTWFIMAVMIGTGWFIGRKLAEPPRRLQVVTEMIVSGFDSICEQTMGKETGRKYLPLIITIFIFVLLSNWIGIIPSVWQVVGRSGTHVEEGAEITPVDEGKGVAAKIKGFLLPEGKVEPVTPEWLAIEEPTKDLNTTLGLGIMCFFIAHVSGIRYKGLKTYIGDYFSPMWFMFPLNIVGEIGKMLSHSFRLFGNIMGGGIILAVVMKLLIKFLIGRGLILPLELGLKAFFGLFVGLVQAFVFAMLALTYIAVMISESE